MRDNGLAIRKPGYDLDMTSKKETDPAEEDVRNQLQRVLTSKLFVANQNSAEFLRVVVDKSLKGEPIKQSILGYELFPKRYLKGDFADVRITALKLRRLLADYYEQEGRNDRILIKFQTPPSRKTRLPAGKAYTPIFSFNAFFPAEAEYQKGLVHQSRLTPTGFADAILCFEKAIDMQPRHAAAHAALAENYCTLTIFACPKPRMLLATARAAAEKAIQIDKTFWQGHAALAAIDTCLWNWDKAEASFQSALRCDEAETMNYPWYSFYLLAVRRTNDAMRLVKKRVRREPHNPGAQRIYWLFMYLTRRYHRALHGLLDLLEFFEYDWAAQLLVILSAFEVHKRPHVLRESDPQILNQGLLGQNDRLIDMTRRMYFSQEIWPGLTALILERRGPQHADLLRNKIIEINERQLESSTREHLQLALALMTVERFDEAIKELARDCANRTPLVMWLHLVPLFDRLKEEKGFQRLIARMKLPGTN
jgi:tetratricopeptide (TPR) repeat protein